MAAITTDSLIAEFVGKLATTGTAPPTTPTAPTTWDCLTGATYDGALTNFPNPLTSSEGWVGDGTAGSPYALQISTAGASDNVVVLANSTALLSGLSAFSIDCWFKSPAVPYTGFSRIIDKSAGSTTGWDIYIVGTSGYLGCDLKVSGAGLGGGQLLTQDYRNAITYFCMTYSDTDDTVRLYANGSTTTGATVLTGGGTVSVSTDSACIGNRTSDYARPWDGWISTVRIYGKQLSTVEIQANFDAGILAASTDPPAFAGLTVTRLLQG